MNTALVIQIQMQQTCNTTVVFTADKYLIRKKWLYKKKYLLFNYYDISPIII